MVGSTAMADEIKMHSHVVAPLGVQILNAEPGSPPTASHPEGTVFATASQRGSSRAFLAEVDVASSASVRQSSLACDTILRAGTRLFANCENELVAFDASLNVLWRSQIRACRDGSPRIGRKLFFDGASRLVEADSCANFLFLRVVSSEYGTVFGNVETGFGALRDWEGLAIYFHGTTILGTWTQELPGPVFVLSNDYSRIATQLLGVGAWDDGVHLHTGRDTRFIMAFDEGRPRIEPKSSVPTAPQLSLMSAVGGIKWLLPDRDYTLSDSLAPLGWTAFKDPEPTPDHLMGDGVSGNTIAYEFDQGRQHFWLTRGCCGSGGGGLYVGTR